MQTLAALHPFRDAAEALDACTDADHHRKIGDRVSPAMRQWAKRHNPAAKFAVRKVDGGIRVWRIA